MKTFWLCVAGAVVFVAAPASAIDCRIAADATERAICGAPDLLQADRQVGALYARVVQSSAANVKAEARRRQRAWIGERDAACPTAARDCLLKIYAERRDVLRALMAFSESGDGEIAAVDAPVLRGHFQAARVWDPEGGPAAVDAAASLADAGLPPVSERLELRPGELCEADRDCAVLAVSRVPLGRIPGGRRIAEDLHADDATAVFVADGRTPHDPPLTLIPRPDGGYAAAFALCGPQASNCRMAFQIWTPAASP